MAQRFILIQRTRIGGTLIVLVALLFWQGTFHRGRHPLRHPVRFLGLAISFGALRLARKWRTPPRRERFYSAAASARAIASCSTAGR